MKVHSALHRFGAAATSLALALATTVSGCKSNPSTTEGPAPPDLATPRPPLGPPIQAPMNTWTWVDFPNAVCDDGTPTGIGVNWSGSEDLLIFLNGGGACWDYLTCVQFNTSSHGPFGSAQFAAVVQGTPGSILDRAAQNPMGSYNMVFVPYCTGDLHGGDNVATYASNGSTRTIHHKGRANLIAFLSRLAATFPAPRKLVLSGSSAGGYGSTIAYDLFHGYFSSSKLYQLNDSGPLLLGDAVPQILRDSWYASWGLDKWLPALCPDCKQDLSLLIPALASTYSAERFALLSYDQDNVIRAYLQQTGPQFQTNLNAMATVRYDLLPRTRYYFVSGSNHTFLGKPGTVIAQGVPLWNWLTQFVEDDPAWTSTKP